MLLLYKIIVLRYIVNCAKCITLRYYSVTIYFY
nr:MAG TPA: hypothetical protein [Bacteriophage sp.]